MQLWLLLSREILLDRPLMINQSECTIYLNPSNWLSDAIKMKENVGQQNN